MARQVLAVQAVPLAGIVPAYQAVTVDGDKISAGGKTVILHVKNAGASPCTVTIQAPGKYQGLTITAPTVSVANGTEKMIKIAPIDAYAQSDGMVYVDYSYLTSVTAAAFQE